ncbi:SDR family NAD(P)-dependent oxidoreductase [Devosia sp. 63-57]|uniref:SDR family oxidoreductase n=1 Tax=Devosia sp. 63-57 TaxID=1895751 RepID=UPI00086B2224|nr:SDR family NAD(P)-dependent oxidoreductase [Devosia sp. 63-57]ODT47316.1 MAG: 3-oxoacyl-[acyl-carrier-protein] reductase [Pelagibacterium sp. SCN 63-126]ODU86993.1 MAG: 3-oxoacyl-[acyl-carrier-protein] reductase [Pelagibacterium sp. SCN 63-17]OJX42976.1 MAG: 3-oxoacyl-[acyl-carrier-protein] reductase [Devosia sp. 63-57]
MAGLTNKVALVTGAGSGIGKATALALAEAGATVVAMSRTAEEVEATAAEIVQQGGKAAAATADITDDAGMGELIAKIEAEHGRLDIVVANAGINGVWAPIDELTPEEWDQTMTVNLKGTYLTIHHAVPALERAGGGAIVVVSSINGTRTFTSPGATAYSATKAGQLAMVQQLSLELGKRNIRINAVCPGAIESDIDDNTEHRNSDKAGIAVEFPDGDIPLTDGESGQARDVADVITFLVSDGARHVTGSPVWIDGGQSLLR